MIKFVIWLRKKTKWNCPFLFMLYITVYAMPIVPTSCLGICIISMPPSRLFNLFLLYCFLKVALVCVQHNCSRTHTKNELHLCHFQVVCVFYFRIWKRKCFSSVSCSFCILFHYLASKVWIYHKMAYKELTLAQPWFYFNFPGVTLVLY